MLAKCQGGGLCIAFPNVCKTPAPPSPTPVPVPYPSIAMDATNVAFVPNVLLTGTPAHNLSTHAPMTQGDSPGVLLGIASPTVMGPCRAVTAAFTVVVGGMPLTRTTSITQQNGMNAAGAKVMPSATNVVVLAP